MIRRRRRSWVLAAVAVVAAGACAGRAGASSLAYYQLKNTGTSPVSLVVAEVSPANSVTTSGANPFSVITTPSGPTGTSVSTGFDPTGPNGFALDTFGEGKLANGDPLQVLKLQFDSKGFAPGAVMNFAIDLGSNYAGALPSLILADPTTGLTPAGLSLTPFTPPAPPAGTGTGSGTPTGGGGATPGNNVPEPVSIAVWTLASGLGLIRARAFRRARQLEA